MDITHIFILAAIQGVTEFIPVSSSGHLNLLHALTPLPDHGVGLDVALHAGTLCAVMLYFRRDIGALLAGGADIVARRRTPNANMTTLLIIASLPVLVAGGVLMATGFVNIVRTAEIIAWANILFAVPLWAADRWGQTTHALEQLKRYPALLIGCAQVLALIPGVSRAGIVLTASRAFGLARPQAVRLAMLLSVPVIFCFALAHVFRLVIAGNAPALADAIIAGSVAALIALASIHLFVVMTRRLSLLPFVLYRLGLGGLLLWLI